jgi:hypothetical protein
LRKKRDAGKNFERRILTGPQRFTKKFLNVWSVS